MTDLGQLVTAVRAYIFSITVHCWLYDYSAEFNYHTHGRCRASSH